MKAFASFQFDNEVPPGAELIRTPVDAPMSFLDSSDVQMIWDHHADALETIASGKEGAAFWELSEENNRAYKNSGLQGSSERFERVSGLNGINQQMADAMQSALIQVAQAHQGDESAVVAAMLALTGFGLAYEPLGLDLAPNKLNRLDFNAQYPRRDITRVVPFEFLSPSGEVIQVNNAAMISKWWREEVLEVLLSPKRPESDRVSLERERWAEGVPLDIPDDVTAKVFGLQHLETESCKAAQAALFAVYNSYKSDLAMEPLIDALLVFIRAHPLLNSHFDNPRKEPDGHQLHLVELHPILDVTRE